MNFRVGQKVVCVDDRDCFDQRERGLRAAIKKGEIYSISWCGPYDEFIGVRLTDVVRDHPRLPDYPFRASRFRPVVERKTDIAVFTEILRNATKRKPVKATT